jgi:hypothetical protein
MKIQKLSIRKIVKLLNDEDEDGGFWLPNIQRPFVWTEEQICRLFDSILRQYPISTLLVWKTKLPIRRRKFIDHFKPEHVNQLSTFAAAVNTKKKGLVLDGQQRLQSLYIGLCGSFEGRELYFDILSGDVTAPEDIKYRFRFLDSKTTAFPWIKFQDLVSGIINPVILSKELTANAGRPLSEAEQAKIAEHVGLIFLTFQGDDGIGYQELDSIDHPEMYTENDVVEVFIRANSGGTKLGKSDLLFSLLTTAWDEADQRMEDLLSQLNKYDFEFTRDFVLKTCLTLLKKGARYEVEKFRSLGVREDIEANWESICKAILDVLDFVRGKTFIRCDKAIPSYLALIPLIYARYHFEEAWKSAKDQETFLLRSLLAGAFSGSPDQLIDTLTAVVDIQKAFHSDMILGMIREAGRSIAISKDRLWAMGYESDQIHLLFNLLYRDFNYTPAYDRNFPQVDHIFPQSILKKIKSKNPDTGRMDLQKYRAPVRDQLANCMLLTADENGAGGKRDIPPEEWFKNKSEEYLTLHMIPKDEDLWKLENFERFVEERKKLIAEKCGYLLLSEQP